MNNPYGRSCSLVKEIPVNASTCPRFHAGAPLALVPGGWAGCFAGSICCLARRARVGNATVPLLAELSGGTARIGKGDTRGCNTDSGICAGYGGAVLAVVAALDVSN